MANYFLDTNIFLRSYEGTYFEKLQKLSGKNAHISALTIHIAAYVHKLHMPREDLIKHTSFFEIVPITKTIAEISLHSPTKDYEDNIQLNSAEYVGATHFITLDKDLLKMKQYEKMRIVHPSDL